MAQQINLFDARFRRGRSDFSARTLAAVIAGLFAVIGAAALAFALHAASLRRDLAQAERERDVLREGVQRLQAQARRAPSRDLQEQAARLAGNLAAQSALLAHLKSDEFGTTAGLSGYFTALARQRLEGVWLTLIRVDAAAGSLVLRGGLLQPELLPAWLERIRREEILRGRTFEQMRMVAHERNRGRPAAGAGSARDYVEFELGAVRTQGTAR